MARGCWRAHAMQVLMVCSMFEKGWRSRAAQSFEPPSTAMMSPVIQRASSETRNAMTEATSSGWPMRLSACMPITVVRPSSVLVKFDMSVSITPGATALTRMPRGAERGGEIFHQRIDGALGAGIGRQRADRGARAERRQEHDAAAVAHDRQQLLHQEIRRADVDGEQAVEVLDRHGLERRRVRNPGIGHEDVEPAADDQVAHLRGEDMGAVGRGEIGGDRVGAAAGGADLIDHRFGFVGIAAVMDDDAGAGGGERQRGGAAHAARGAGHEGGLVGEVGHDGLLVGRSAMPSASSFGHEDGRPLPLDKDFVCSSHALKVWIARMELRHLRYFVAVAEEGSLTNAAERRLHTAQPSLSRQIRDLELEVGVKLLERGARGIALTAAGRIFLDHARLALLQVEAAGEAARRAAQPEKAAFVIGFLTGQELVWLPEALRILREEQPDIEITLASQSSPELAGALMRGKVDVAFLRREAQAPGLAFKFLIKEPLVAVLPTGHRLAARKDIRLAGPRRRDLHHADPRGAGVEGRRSKATRPSPASR